MTIRYFRRVEERINESAWLIEQGEYRQLDKRTFRGRDFEKRQTLFL